MKESGMSDDETEWDQVIQGLRRNDSGVVRHFFQEYGQVLHAIAEKQIATGFQRRFDADDVVQSAFRTFFRRAKGGEFQLADSEQLWSLLCAITLNKVREKVRFYRRQKRGVDREVSMDAGEDSRHPGLDVASPQLSPAEAAEFTDEFERLMSSLDAEERMLVDLKLQDCTNEEVATRMGISERTVRRVLNRVKDRLTVVFGVGKS